MISLIVVKEAGSLFDEPALEGEEHRLVVALRRLIGERASRVYRNTHDQFIVVFPAPGYLRSEDYNAINGLDPGKVRVVTTGI